jgi:di/tricarboxylate transporter
VNVLVSEAALDAGHRAIGFFEFTIVGIPLLLGVITITLLFGRKLLPHRAGETMSADFSRHATTLVEQYRLKEGLFRLRLRATSPLIGQPPSALKESSWGGLRLVAVNDGVTGDRLGRG